MSDDTRREIEVVISLSPWILFLLLILWGFARELLEPEPEERRQRARPDA
ncbi:MAG TPA: hypothetical protein VIA10_17125 [Gaiellaceae bacterium]